MLVIKMIMRPKSIEECLYFTNRAIGNGKAVAWVLRKQCVKCNQGHMIKPLKRGKPDKKAEFYICNKCSYQESNNDVESNLIMNVEYKCPYCDNESQTTAEYKRKSFQGILSYAFECQKCHKVIGLTKKLKQKN